MKRLTAILAILAVPGLLLACPVRIRTYAPSYVSSYVAPTVVTPVAVVEKVAVAVLAPFAVQVPVYSSAFGPPPVQPAPQPPPQQQYQNNGNVELLQELRLLRQRLDVLEGGARAPVPQQQRQTVPPLPTMPPAKDDLPPKEAPQSGGATGAAPAVASVYQARCVACHAAGKQSSGGGFVFFDAQGRRQPLTPEKGLKFALRVYKGEMPPPENKLKVGPCTDEEVAAIMEDLGK